MISPESHLAPLLVQPSLQYASSVGTLDAVMNLTLFTSSPCAGAPALLVEKGPAPNPHRDYGGSTKSEQKYSVQSTEYSTFIGTTNIKHGPLCTVELLAYAIEESGPSVEGEQTLNQQHTGSTQCTHHAPHALAGLV